jgi:hypothetical protein
VKECHVPEINDLLDAERNRRPAAARRARIALIVAGVASVVAVSTAATLVATGATTLAEQEAESSALDDLVSAAAERITRTAGPGASTSEGAPTVPAPSEPAPTEPPDAAQAAQNEFGFPVYDASTDIATIPRPVDDPDPAGTEIWLAQRSITAHCMQQKGLEYRYTAPWLVPPGVTREQRLAELQPQPGTAEFEALYGVPEFGPDDPAVAPEYRWEDAGCVGYAVHVTGMDGAH